MVRMLPGCGIRHGDYTPGCISSYPCTALWFLIFLIHGMVVLSVAAFIVVLIHVSAIMRRRLSTSTKPKREALHAFGRMDTPPDQCKLP